MTRSLDKSTNPASASAAARRRVLIASAGGFLGFYLELSVVPYIGARYGGRFAAGVLTFALLTATVALQAVIPLLLRRFGARTLLAGGLFLLGAPTPLYALSHSVGSLIAVTLVRGAGFGLLTVMGSALVGEYSAPGSRGSALGVYGVASSVWAAFAPGVGVGIVRSSESAIFVLGAVAPLVAMLALVPRLPPAFVPAQVSPRSSTSQRSELVPPAVMFTTVAAAIAAAFTFVPLLHGQSTFLLLIVFGTGFTTGRVLSGYLLDRGGSPTALVLSLLVGVVVGLAMLGTSDAAVVTVGAAASGLAIGCLTTVTLVMMFDRAGSGGLARASVVWNMAYDVGQATGAVAFGVVASLFHPSGVFIAAAVVIALVGWPVAVYDWRKQRPRLRAA